MDPWQSRQPALEVTQYQPGWVKCPTCGFRFALADRRRWSGHRHLRCGQRLRITDAATTQPEPVWCVVGNVGEAGTKAFKPGTRVYCFPPLWGDGWERVKVVGKHRESGKFATVIVRRAAIANLRVEQVRKPNLLDWLSGPWDGTQQSKELAEALVNGS